MGMIGMVLVTHGDLAKELVAALEHVVGPQEKTETVCIGPNDDVEARRRDIADSVARADDGGGVILLTDMFGGTPSNLAISLMKDGHVEVIAGVNLPMLVKLSSVRGRESLAEAVASAQEAGRKYISVASASTPARTETSAVCADFSVSRCKSNCRRAPCTNVSKVTSICLPVLVFQMSVLSRHAAFIRRVRQ